MRAKSSREYCLNVCCSRVYKMGQKYYYVYVCDRRKQRNPVQKEREGIVLKETNGRILSEGVEVETSIYKAIVQKGSETQYFRNVQKLNPDL